MSKEFIELKNKTIFITGVAGFIGSNLAERLLKEIEGIKIVGLDNMNDYYDVRLKEYRLEKLSSSKTFSFVKGNLADILKNFFEIFLTFCPLPPVISGKRAKSFKTTFLNDLIPIRRTLITE